VILLTLFMISKNATPMYEFGYITRKVSNNNN